MTMNRLFEIAEELHLIALDRMTQRQTLDTVNRNIKAREAAMIPDGGWPGSNADTRKAAELAAKSTDKQLVSFDIESRVIQDQLQVSEIKRDALIEERDAIRWTIRDNEQMSHEGGSGYSVLKAWQNNLDQDK
jgi:hypothetical protein